MFSEVEIDTYFPVFFWKLGWLVDARMKNS